MPAAPLTAVLQRLRRSASAALSDRELLERYRACRDEAAFAALVERHGPMVLGIARRLLTAHDTDDVFQATFLVLARKPGAIRNQDSVGGWLYGVAFRIARKLRARQARERERRRRLEQRVGDRPFATCPTAALACQEVEAAIMEELKSLPDHYRVPLLLCCLGSKTRDEAAALGWTVTVLRGRLDRGRQMLRACLKRRGPGAARGLPDAGPCRRRPRRGPPCPFRGDPPHRKPRRRRRSQHRRPIP